MSTILFIYGEDTYRSRQKLAAIKRRYIDASLGDTNLAVLDGTNLTFEVWVRQIQALPFLAKSRLVVTENLLLEGKKDLLEQVEKYLPKIPDSTVVVLYEAGVPDKRTKLFKRLNQPKLADQYEPLVGAALTRWIDQQANVRSLMLTPDQVAYLVRAVPRDLWRLANELDKLAAFVATGRPIVLDQIRELVPQGESSDVFQLIETIARGQAGPALAELDRLIRQGEAELYVLSMIVYQFRTLLLIADAYERGIQNSSALVSALKIAPFVADKGLRLVRALTFAELAQRYKRLLAYDLAIKTGELEPRLALELLITEFALPVRS